VKLLVHGVTVVVIRPIELLPELVNHSAPSRPAVIPTGAAMPGPVLPVTFPVGVIRPRRAADVRLPVPGAIR